MALFPKACDRLGWRRTVQRTAGWLAVVVLLVGATLVESPRAALAADDVFTVVNIPVDATAATATAARERALQEGQRRAFNGLLQRLTPASERARVPQLTDAAIADMVRDFEIARERTSPVRYIAALTVRFNPADVRTLLRENRVAYSETPSKPVLVLPVVESPQGRLLADNTDWYAAWARFVPGDGLVPFLLPSESSDDIGSLVTADQAAAGDPKVLANLANRAGAGSVLVPVARERRVDGSGHDPVEVSAARFGAGAGEEAFVASFAPQSGDAAASAVLDRAVVATAAQVEENWKRSSLLRFDSLKSIAVSVPLGELGSLVAVERGLEGLAPVQRVDIVRINRDQAEIRLTFVGDDQQLKLLLAQRDLLLSNDGAAYVLRPTGMRAGAAR